MPVVDICEAKARLSILVEQAASGHDVVIARGGKPVARLTRLDSPRRRIRFGLLKGRVRMAPVFDSPLPAEIQAKFEGR